MSIPIAFSPHALPVISDIHGNSSGLIQVLKRIGELGLIRPPLILGDLAWTYWSGYEPLEVLDMLLELPTSGVVCGNTDEWLINGMLENWVPDTPEEAERKDRLLAIKTSLSRRHLDYLAGLPQSLKVQLGDFDVLAVHASPLSSGEGLPPAADEQTYIRLLAGEEPDILVSGHLHQIYSQRIKRIQHFSMGAAGKHPGEYDGIIHFAILDRGPEGPFCWQGSLVQQQDPNQIRR